MGDIRVE